jgi:hypothetical protein
MCLWEYQYGFTPKSLSAEIGVVPKRLGSADIRDVPGDLILFYGRRQGRVAGKVIMVLHNNMTPLRRSL